jgi:drug/metabolite transporter (DMT)-like permease
MMGAVWAVVAGLTLGLFQLANRRAGQELDTARGNFLLLLAALVVLVGGVLASEDIRSLAQAPVSAWWNYSLAGFVHFLGGWSLLTISQKRIGAARTGSLMGVTPLFGAVLALLIFGEGLNLAELAGIGLIVAGVYLVSNG